MNKNSDLKKHTMDHSMIHKGTSFKFNEEIYYFNTVLALLWVNVQRWCWIVLNFWFLLISGHFCEREQPCLNGGTCGYTRGGYICKCLLGYQGYNCQEGNTNMRLSWPFKDFIDLLKMKSSYRELAKKISQHSRPLINTPLFLQLLTHALIHHVTRAPV